MILTEDKLNRIIFEELNKSEIVSLINSKLDTKLTSREFKKQVKELAADVVSELFKILWQRNSFWKSSVSN